jgi:hypothetical protein
MTGGQIRVMERIGMLHEPLMISIIRVRSSDGPGIARAQPVLFHLGFGIWDLGFGI